MSQVVAVKIRYADGTFSNPIPIKVLAQHVEWGGTYSLVEVLTDYPHLLERLAAQSNAIINVSDTVNDVADTVDIISETSQRLHDNIANLENNLGQLDERIQNIKTGEDVYFLYIECPNGTNIHGTDLIFNAKLFRNSIDVTDDFDDSCFIWTRHSQDYYGDIYWNDQHSEGTKTIRVTANDVRINADFQCKFEYDDVTVTSD